MKEMVAKEIAKRVTNGDVIGVGSGTTVDAALVEIGLRVRQEKLDVSVLPTSLESAWACQKIGMRVLTSAFAADLDWGFDGADAVDNNLWLIKGKGGALFQEKVVAARCKKFIVIVDETKVVSNLAAACAVPVEVMPAARFLVEKHLAKLSPLEISLRTGTGKRGPVITEQGNVILDVTFKQIEAKLEQQIKSIVGVVETGLFIGYASEVLVGSATAVRVLK